MICEEKETMTSDELTNKDKKERKYHLNRNLFSVYDFSCFFTSFLSNLETLRR